MTTQSVFSVTTEKRTYNHVESVSHFIKVRRNWEDWSEIQSVTEWIGNKWEVRDPMEWVKNEM